MSRLDQAARLRGMLVRAAPDGKVLIGSDVEILWRAYANVLEEMSDDERRVFSKWLMTTW